MRTGDRHLDCMINGPPSLHGGRLSGVAGNKWKRRLPAHGGKENVKNDCWGNPRATAYRAVRADTGTWHSQEKLTKK